MKMDYAVFDSLQDSVLVIDKNFAVYYANQAASDLLNTSVKRLKNGKPLSDVIQFSSDIVGKEGFPNESFSPMRELEFKTGSDRSGALQVNLQIDLTTTQLSEVEKRWIVYLRDVSLEKILHTKYLGELDQKENVINDLRKVSAQLEDYSKNLELKVDERTEELKSSNLLLEAILNSLDQGIVVFNKSGSILPYFSKMSQKLFRSEIRNLNITAIISKTLKIQNEFREWLSVSFDEILDFEDIKDLAPRKLGSDVTEQEVSLSYNPMRSPQGKIESIVMVATDKTEEMLAKAQADHERILSRRIMQMTKFKSQFRSFARDALAILQRLVQHTKTAITGDRPIEVELVSRELHTFKGGAATFALDDIATLAHQCEDILTICSRVSDQPGSPFRHLLTSLEKLDSEFKTFLGENEDFYGGPLTESGNQVDVSNEMALAWLKQLQFIPEAKVVYAEIENLFTREEIGAYFLYLDESLSELAKKLGKKIEPLKLTHPNLRVEAKHYKELFSNLIHIFRNSIDHGFETPEVRTHIKKVESGSIEIEFSLENFAANKMLKIVIADDGAGIDPNKIKERMRSLNYDERELQKIDSEIIQVIFDPHFSSRQVVSEISGRGVGLYAVKNAAEKLGGTIQVESKMGYWTRFTIIVPFIVDSQITRAA